MQSRRLNDMLLHSPKAKSWLCRVVLSRLNLTVCCCSSTGQRSGPYHSKPGSHLINVITGVCLRLNQTALHERQSYLSFFCCHLQKYQVNREACYTSGWRQTCSNLHRKLLIRAPQCNFVIYISLFLALVFICTVCAQAGCRELESEWMNKNFCSSCRDKVGGHMLLKSSRELWSHVCLWFTESNSGLLYLGRDNAVCFKICHLKPI